MMMRSVELDFYSAGSLKQQSADRHKNVMGTCLDTFANKIKATGKYFNYNI
jgi:hypothetical protein